MIEYPSFPPMSDDQIIRAIVDAREEQQREATRIRALVLQARKQGITTVRLAADLGISPGTLSYWLKTAASEKDGDRPARLREGRKPNR